MRISYFGFLPFRSGSRNRTVLYALDRCRPKERLHECFFTEGL
jgi:hypothetical protein